MSQDAILSALLDIKSDTGETRAQIAALNAWMTAHAAEDAKAHDRIAALELNRARQSGAGRVWHLVSVAGGSLVGYCIQFFIYHFKTKT